MHTCSHKHMYRYMYMYTLVNSLSPHISSEESSSNKWFHQQSVSTPHHSNDIRRPSLGFDATTAKELAEIMAALDYKLFRRIPVSEKCTLTAAWVEDCIVDKSYMKLLL